ncbi:hypothetical protein HBI08_189170 [Parastagonospora nodorum]|nr:hypothetical protein HBI08_189170 [Parastagonospora nodorum]
MGVNGSDAYPSLITSGLDCACKRHYLHVPRTVVFGMSLLGWDTVSATDPRFDFSSRGLVTAPNRSNSNTAVGSDLFYTLLLFTGASKLTTTDVVLRSTISSLLIFLSHHTLSLRFQQHWTSEKLCNPPRLKQKRREFDVPSLTNSRIIIVIVPINDLEGLKWRTDDTQLGLSIV